MLPAILVTKRRKSELKLLMEGALGDQATVWAYSSLSDLFPDILKMEPALCLIDGESILPEELSVIKTLKKTYPAIRIIFTFQADQRETASRALISGVDTYILEPFFIDELAFILRREFKNSLEQSRLTIDLRMDALASFVEGLAPEVNNPLTTIRGFLQILLSREAYKMSSHEFEEIYNLMEKESGRIVQIVRELENFSRARKPKKMPANMNNLITTAINQARTETGLEIPVTVDFGDFPEESMIDYDQILAALKSVLQFLLKGTDEKKGRIEVSLSLAEKDETVVIVLEGIHSVLLAQDVDQAFIPMYSRKIIRFREELGLASSYGIIRAHGGSIHVNVTENGSRFVVEIPG